jgi:hypothetical protein
VEVVISRLKEIPNNAVVAIKIARTAGSNPLYLKRLPVEGVA